MLARMQLRMAALRFFFSSSLFAAQAQQLSPAPHPDIRPSVIPRPPQSAKKLAAPDLSDAASNVTR